jgi:hypothetical protein
VALEAIGAHGGPVSVDVPTAPTYTLRLGVADNVDLGFRAANLTTFGFDGKINFIRGGFDLAVDPGIQAFYYSLGSSAGNASASQSVSGAYFHLPLLFGINVSQGFTIVPTAGIMYGVVSTSASVSSDSGNDSVKASGNSGIIGRFGLGFDARVSSGFALHPEVTIMKSFKEGAEGILYLAGLGFNFGHLPDYSDIK